MRLSQWFKKGQINLKIKVFWLTHSSNSIMMRKCYSSSPNKLESKKEERKQQFNTEYIFI